MYIPLFMKSYSYIQSIDCSSIGRFFGVWYNLKIGAIRLVGHLLMTNLQVLEN